MARYSGFRSKFDSTPLLLLTLFFDVLIHMSLVGQTQHICDIANENMPYSSHKDHSSLLVMIPVLVVLFFFCAVSFEVTKHCIFGYCGGWGRLNNPPRCYCPAKKRI